MDYTILSRSYDLRGIYGVDIDEDFFLRMGYAFAKVTQKSRIALWYDARLSSPVLKNAFTDGANLAWATIIDIGMCSSDMLSFATCHYDDIEAWVMITASHNPKEYNGMKCLNHSWEPYNLKKYGKEMVDIMSEMKIGWAPITPMIEEKNILEDWIEHILAFTGKGIDYSKYTIVADGGNGVAWVFMGQLAEKAWFAMIPLYLEPDGDFPNHHPNPILAKNREEARQIILDGRADLGFCFDGDADRIMILDDLWNTLTSWIISSVIVKMLDEKYPKSSYVGNTTVSHIFRDTVTELWCTYEREMVGHVYIREHMMKDKNIIYAWEHSAHYFFRDNYYMDSGILAGMVFLGLIAQSWKKISEVVREYEKYVTLEESNFEVPNPKWAIEELTKIYMYEKYDLSDWITVEYDDGSWWNFRPSSNEPLLRLNMEARTQERFDALFSEIMEHVRRFGESSDH